MATVFKTEEGAALVRAHYEDLLRRLPLENEHIWISTELGRTFVLACGPPDAPPLLLFHGSGGNSATWWHDLLVWSKSFRVYAIDIIGEPGLSAQARPTLADDTYARWVDEVMAALSLERAAIVGISLGGWLALHYATHRPEKVSRLALMCPGGVGKQKVTFFLKALPLLLFGAWGRRKGIELATGKATPQDFEGMNLWIFIELVFTHFNPRMEPLPRFTDKELRRLTMPVMLTVGGKDVMFDSRETRRKLEACAPALTVRFLADAPHGLRGQAEPINAFLTAPQAA